MVNKILNDVHRYNEAALVEAQSVHGEFSYFLQSDREMIGEVMEQVTELAAAEGERAGRVCAQCGKEIDSVKDGFVMCRDNFIQAKYFQEMDGSDNVFCSQDCACQYQTGSICSNKRYTGIKGPRRAAVFRGS